MTKRGRTVLFLSCLVLFMAIAPLAIFYSQGYRFDFKKRAVTQTGGLFVKTWPKSSEVYLDGKLIKKTDGFYGRLLIENLLPGRYEVEIKKNGYAAWLKALTIKEKEVTEAKDIFLTPGGIDFNVLTREIKNFWPSPDGKKIIISEMENNRWVLKLYDQEKNLKSYLIGEKDTSFKGTDLLGLEWSGDSKLIHLDLGIAERERKFALAVNGVPQSLREEEPGHTASNVVVSSDNYYLDNSGFVYKDDGRQKINRNPFQIKPETEYSLKIFEDFVFLQEGDNLYLFNKDSGSFEKFFENAKGVKISPESKRLVIFSNSEIWLFFLKDVPDQPTKKAKEFVFLARLSEKINDVFWLNENYLAFNAGDEIKIAETDDRDHIQSWDVKNFASPKMIFDKINGKIYVLSGGNLYVSGKLDY